MTSLLLIAILSGAPKELPSAYSLKSDAFVEMARGDLKTLRMFVQGMSTVSARVAENKLLFALKRDQVYSPEQKRTLLSTWGSLFSYFSATESLRQKYWDFVKLPPTDPRHAWGFVVTHTALTALLSYGTAFADLTINNKQLETLFDETNDEFGVPAGAFAAFKLTSIHVATATQLVTGDTWSVTLLPLLKTSRALDDPQVAWAMSEMRRNSKIAKEALTRKGVKLFAGNAKDIVQDETARAVFPVQKSFASWAGDTRVQRVGKPLVTRDVVDKVILPRLTSGDILVSRQNWFLSNIGLPGFWPHAMLYVGTAKDLAAALDGDAQVKAWAAAEPEKAASLTDLLSRRYPEKWKTYASGQDFQGHGPIRVIESISEGVSFTAVEHAFGVDYLAAMRPRLANVDKARAIERAFHYQGRPYDFDFDFFSDSTLVCTELVFKAYQPAPDGAGFQPPMKGLRLGLVDVAGRRTLPANEIVKLFDAELDRPDRQLDFVFFIDAREKDDTTAEADAKALRSSWQRVKWDVAQK